MKRFTKAYIEISNVCNLRCSFCPGTKRKKQLMTAPEFRTYLSALVPYTDYVYLHLLGEPLLHPELPELLRIADKLGEKVIVTTNGTLLPETAGILLHSPALHKVNISLHSFEANDIAMPFETYLHGCIGFAEEASRRGIIISFRLWNHGGADTKNDEILAALRAAFPIPPEKARDGLKLKDKVFLQYAEKFEWPTPDAPDYGENGFCYGLRDQLGVLCDGTVVPCCLDGEGAIPLGNLNEQSVDEILNSERARAIYDGFSKRVAAEPLCRHCGYARRFSG